MASGDGALPPPSGPSRTGPPAAVPPVFLPPSAEPEPPRRGPTWLLVALAAVLAFGLGALAVAWVTSDRESADTSAGPQLEADPDVEASGPGATDPGVAESGATDPGATDPGATDPGATDPGAADTAGATDDAGATGDPLEPVTTDAAAEADGASDDRSDGDASDGDSAGDAAAAEPLPAELPVDDEPAAGSGRPDADDQATEGSGDTDPDPAGDPDDDPDPNAASDRDAAADPDTGEARNETQDGAGETPGGAGDVAESRAVIRNGQIFLEGAVPTRAAADEIVALAAEILGPDNVIDEYVIDERAGDPSLGNITVEDTINFATGSAVLLPESEGLLNQGLALMTIRPAVTIEIVGHTDARGSEEYNQELSEARAEAVKRWFVDRDIDPDRLETRGAGESEPIADNDTADGRLLNRRIQFFLRNILGDA